MADLTCVRGSSSSWLAMAWREAAARAASHRYEASCYVRRRFCLPGRGAARYRYLREINDTVLVPMVGFLLQSLEEYLRSF